jgi:predicted anti-sigma-YlaC factor YlaD
MNCDQIRELLPDVAAGMDSGGAEVQAHVASCAGCAAKLTGLRQTMALLDEWQAAEPSAYFDTRLQARLREEMARPVARASWLHWLRVPAMAASFALVLVAGTVVFHTQSMFFPGDEAKLEIRVPTPSVPAEVGSAVGDLQALERNNELYADFDVLDELQVQNDVTANP